MGCIGAFLVDWACSLERRRGETPFLQEGAGRRFRVETVAQGVDEKFHGATLLEEDVFGRCHEETMRQEEGPSDEEELLL